MTIRRYRTYDFTLEAGDSIPIVGLGSFVRCLAADGPFLVGIDDEATAEFSQGLGVELDNGATFERLRIENSGSTTITGQLAIGLGRIHDSRASFADAIPVGSSPNLTTGPDVSAAAGDATLLAAADPKRREIIIINRSVNAREIRIGDSDAAATEGIELLPGERLRLHVTAAVYAYNPHSAAASVSVSTISGN